jgi:hypothetical protein
MKTKVKKMDTLVLRILYDIRYLTIAWAKVVMKTEVGLYRESGYVGSETWNPVKMYCTSGYI